MPFYLAEMHEKHTLSPCRCSRYGPACVHQNTPAVPSGRMTLYWLVKASMSTIRHKHSIIFMLSCIFLCRQLLLITWGRWGKISQRETQKKTQCESQPSVDEWCLTGNCGKRRQSICVYSDSDHLPQETNVLSTVSGLKSCHLILPGNPKVLFSPLKRKQTVTKRTHVLNSKSKKHNIFNIFILLFIQFESLYISILFILYFYDTVLFKGEMLDFRRIY